MTPVDLKNYRKLIGGKASKNLSWLFVANAMKGFYHWSLIILIVKFLQPEDVGFFTLAFAVTAPFYMFFNLQLKSIYIVDFRKIGYDFNYFIIRLGGVFFALISTLIYSYCNDYNMLILLLVAIIKSIESISEIIHASFQKKEMMHLMSISIILQSFFSLLAFAGTLYLVNDLVISLTIIIITLLAIFILYDLKKFIEVNNLNLKYITFIKSNLLRKRNLKFIKKLLFNALPLGLAVFVGSYLTNLPRIYVEKYIGIKQLAFFGAMSYMAVGFIQFLQPIQIVLRPRLAKMLQKKSYRNFMRHLVLSICATILFGLFLEAIFYFFGSIIISKIYNEEYTNYIDILRWLIFSQILLSIAGYFNIAVQSFYLFKLQLVVALLALCIVIFWGPFLIKTYSVTGAVYLVNFYSIFNLLSYIGLFVWKKRW